MTVPGMVRLRDNGQEAMLPDEFAHLLDDFGVAF